MCCAALWSVGSRRLWRLSAQARPLPIPIVRNCAQSGVVVIPTGAATVKASIDHTRSEGNGSSGYVAEGNTNVTVSNSVAAGNAGGGFVSEQATGTTKRKCRGSTRKKRAS